MELNLDIYPERFGKTEIDTPILFDLDGTLVTYNKKDRLKWDFYPYVTEWLNLHKGQKIIIISNQKNYDNALREKISDILRELRKIVIVDIFISTGVSWYRKPSPKIFVDKILKPNTEYIFVGDAAGRGGDFSDSDRLFAYNANLAADEVGSSVTFMTPENFFLGDNSKLPPVGLGVFKNRKYDPKKDRETVEKVARLIEKDKKSLIIMSGLPGSGKSFFTDYLISCMDYHDKSVIIVTKDKDDVHQNKPILVSTKLSRKKIAEISEYDTVIWDTTAYSKEKRKEIIDTFPDYTHYIIWMKTDKKEREWLRFYRTVTQNITLPDIALKYQEKHFDGPTKGEVPDGHLIEIETFSLIDWEKLGVEGKYLCSIDKKIKLRE